MGIEVTGMAGSEEGVHEGTDAGTRGSIGIGVATPSPVVISAGIATAAS